MISPSDLKGTFKVPAISSLDGLAAKAGAGAAVGRPFSSVAPQFKNAEQVAEGRRKDRPDVVNAATPLCQLQFAQLPEPDKMWVTRASARFTLFGGYRCEVDFATDEKLLSAPLNGGDLVGEPALLTFHRWLNTRFLHGLITDFKATPGMNAPENRPSDFRFYTVTLESPLAHEAWTVPPDCKILQDTSAPDVLKALLSNFKGQRGNVRWVLDDSDLAEDYPPFDYLVQWQETPYDFFHRVCGEAGIAYTFIHEKDTLTLKLFDKNPEPGGTASLDDEDAWKQGQTWLPFYDEEKAGDHGAMYELAATIKHKAVPGVVVRDVKANSGELLQANYDSGKTEGQTGFWNVGIEGGFKDPERAARLQSERLACSRSWVDCTLNALKIAPGDTLQLDPAKSLVDQRDVDLTKKSYYVTEVRIEHKGSIPDLQEEGGEADDAGAGGDEAGKGFSQNFFCKLIDLQTQFRPDSWKPQPAIGPQMGRVVAADEDGLLVEDNTGRFRVVFPWYSQGDVSCLVHALEPSQFFQSPITAGTWVLVAFLHNQANRPVIVGVVPSADKPWKHANDPEITSIDTKTTELILDDGKSLLGLASDGNVQVDAQKELLLNGPKVQVTGKGEVVLSDPTKITLQAPLIQLAGKVQAGAGANSFSVDDSGVSVSSQGRPFKIYAKKVEYDTVSLPPGAPEGAQTAALASHDETKGKAGSWELRPVPVSTQREALAAGSDLAASSSGAGDDSASESRVVAETAATTAGFDADQVEVVPEDSSSATLAGTVAALSLAGGALSIVSAFVPGLAGAGKIAGAASGLSTLTAGLSGLKWNSDKLQTPTNPPLGQDEVAVAKLEGGAAAAEKYTEAMQNTVDDPDLPVACDNAADACMAAFDNTATQAGLDVAKNVMPEPIGGRISAVQDTHTRLAGIRKTFKSPTPHDVGVA